MQLLSELRDVFKLDSTSLNSITRKSLLKWSREVEFEDRRDKFYTASCEGKLKSRVSICQKKGKRPDWTVRLELYRFRFRLPNAGSMLLGAWTIGFARVLRLRNF